ncbi:hypothetical protein [Variovorax sp. OAS795]|uniref:hypothetical protein n=1 Tax=Variovorax sp. OAS795 TaxID=3034231 RepID=UPI00339213AC
MDKERWAKAALRRGHLKRKFWGRISGALTLLLLVIAAALALLIALPSFRIEELADANADELLLRLATLGREGSAVLCDPDRIERYLSVRIDKRYLNKNAGNSPMGVNATNQSIVGSYWKHPTSTGTICKLRLQIVGHRFCDTDSARTQRLIGRRVQTQMPVPDETGFYDHGYELTRDSKENSVIGWREPSQLCPADIEIAVAIH